MLHQIPLENTKITDSFWSFYIKNIKENTIPYQYSVLNNSPLVTIENENKKDFFENQKSNALENFRVAAGISSGGHYGMIFQDSDVYKWLEAVAYSLHINPDKELQSLADSVLELIAAAQNEDGYIDTYFQVKEPRLKYRMLYSGHELYCMGHLLEALAAYWQATHNKTALVIAEKVVNHIDTVFGYENGKIQGSDGHPEIELGLLKIYEITQNPTALRLAEFFLDIRGKNTEFYAEEMARNEKDGLPVKMIKVPELKTYLVAHTQPKNMTEAVGHAVRMLYLAAAMARVVHHNNDSDMYSACKAIWDNVTNKKMYITGGVGSTTDGEAFTGNYDLPNDIMYCETCASIALAFFAYDMFMLDPKTEYMDVIERVLYNGILSGASLDGIHFFYVNPLEVNGRINDENPDHGHVKRIRPQWYSCACCPPNFARAIGSVQRYIYTADSKNKEVYINLFADSSMADDGIKIVQSTDFPYGNTVKLAVNSDSAYTVKIRVPYWSRNFSVNVNRTHCEYNTENGYALLQNVQGNTVIEIAFDTPVMAVKANSAVIADANRVAVQRGPFVYCAEQIDNAVPLAQYRVAAEDIQNASVSVENCPLGRIPFIDINAVTERINCNGLYCYNPEIFCENHKLRMLPYYAWANRGDSDMMVWLHQK